MNILSIVTNPFTHDPRVYNEAKSLVKAGHNVTVVAWDRNGVNPVVDKIDGINVVRVYNTRFMNMLPYNIFRLRFWWNEGIKQCLRLYNKNPFDVVHCHNLDTLPIGISLKRKFGIKLVYDAHEIWGYMISKRVHWWKYYIWKEKYIIKNVDKIIVVNEPIKEYIKKFTKKPITVIMNCKSLINGKYEHTNNKKFTIIYIGGLSDSRFIIELVDTANEIPDIKCIIAGSGEPSYVERLKIKAEKTDNVDFIGLLPQKEVIPFTKKADAIICLFKPDNINNQVGLPNKIFESMVTGRPIICTKGLYSGDFIEKEKCGLAVEYNKESLKKAIIELKNNPKLSENLGKNGLKAAKEKYNWEKQEKKLLKIYEEL